MNFSVQTLSFSTRFVQGYRYLDKCGEALIRLETSLGPNWIPGDIAPKGGSIKNSIDNLSARFDASAMTVVQEPVCDFDVFSDAAASCFEILTGVFYIDAVTAPAVKISTQRAYETVEEAEAAFAQANFAAVCDEISRTGTVTSRHLVICTEKEATVTKLPVVQRLRISISVVKQAHQQGLDQRILRRAAELPRQQRDAIQAFWRLRKHFPEVPPIALQIEAELSLEDEVESKFLDAAHFIRNAHNEITETLSDLQSKVPT